MMLSSQLGIRLLIWIGKTIPRPASYELMNALTSVEITNDIGQQGDGFQVSFTLGKNKTGEYSLLQSGVLDPDARIIIGVLLGVALEPLIDGVIYHHQISPGEQPGMSTLTISGRDISVMLDLKAKDKHYEQQTDSTIVSSILENYTQYGLQAPHQVTTTKEERRDNELIPGQHETDLKFIQRLAQRNGFVFYIEPVTMGVNRAYWGAEQREGLRQPALTHDQGASTNVKTLRFTHDALAAIETNGSYLDPVKKKSETIPPLSSLRLPALSQATSSARRTERLRCTANRTSEQASTVALAARTGAAEPVSAEGELDTVRYGGVLRARRLVGVRGVGRSYNGDYFVQQVTHRIQRGVYTQTFTLKRDGTGALNPSVKK